MLINCPKCMSEEQTLISHDDIKHEELYRCEECGFEYITPDIFNVVGDDSYESAFETYANKCSK